MIQRYILSLFCILLLSVLAYIPITNSIAQNRISMDLTGINTQDLTGIWKGQDRGTYYVRHYGNDITWVGVSPDDGKTWTNIFVGKKGGDIISGKWADMPRGKVGGVGTLTLKVLPVVPPIDPEHFAPKIVIQKTGSTGSPFSTSTWEKSSCPGWQKVFYSCGWNRNRPIE
jgi:hypothetical protein